MKTSALISGQSLLAPLALLALAGLGCERPLQPTVQVDINTVTKIRADLKGKDDGAKTGEAAAIKEPTGFGSIRGVIKLVGAAPARRALSIDKDPEMCKPAQAEDLVVNADGGIKDVVIYLTTKYPAGNDKWEHSDYKTMQPAIFDQKNCVFLSHMLAVRSQQKMVIKNSDPKGHNTKIEAKGKAKSINESVGAGSGVDYIAGGESPEPFGVSCSVHPWMSAFMVSRDSPYFAVTKPDGSFEIKNIPSGVDLEFRAWQESSKFIKLVKVNGTEEKWPSGKFKRKLEDNQTLDMNVEVDLSQFGR